MAQRLFVLRGTVFFLIAFVVWLSNSKDLEGQYDHPVVAGFERFIDVETIADTERGLLLLNELNCASCHQLDTNAWASPPRQAPILSQVGSSVQHQYFEQFIAAPHEVKPGTTMPDLLAGKSDKQRQEIAEAIGHFLASTGRAVHQPSTSKDISIGKELFHTVGCVACHNPQASDEKISSSIPLVELDRKYTLPGLVRFLSNPLHSRPSGRMPQLDLKPTEVKSIASYLLRKIKIGSEFNFAFYEGEWKKLPEFDKLEPKETGFADSFDLGRYPRNNNFGLVLTGFLAIEEAGEYQFKISSDDGSRVLVNGTKVAEIDGIHPTQSNAGKVSLEPGSQEIRIEYFEAGGGETLECIVSGPGLAPTSLQTLLTKDKQPAPDRIASIPVDEIKAELGRSYFQEIGCANCHQVEIRNQLVPTKMNRLPAIAQLDPSKGGCLSDGESAPRFHLSAKQKSAISSAIRWLKQESGKSELSANDRVHQQLTTMNCYACHSRETGTRGEEDFRLYGGVVDATGGDSLEIYGRDKWFVGEDAEMGVEGRHPPYLQSVGAKLNPNWLQHVLENGPKDRPYVKTRMPKFGLANMPGLVTDLVSADQLSHPVVVPPQGSPQRIKEHGRFFVGADGLSCIKCHTFGDFHSVGIPAISLTTMTKRLNKDWFQEYMLKPSRFRPGTRMPESWPDGKSFFKDRLEGDPARQIDAIWNYLADGEKARQPKGLRKTKMEVVALEHPTIYRNFIEGAGPRAIGVGYPERLNLAFRADECRVAMIWQENFIDGGRHWTGRGQGFEPPLGENVMTLSDRLPFFKAELSEDPVTWPKSSPHLESRQQGVRFLGYDLDNDLRPIFRYTFDGLNVSDFWVPVQMNEQQVFRRKFTITGSLQKYRYLAATGNEIQPLADGSFRIDDGWTTKIAGDGTTCKVVEFDGKKGLVVQFSKATRIEFQQDYVW